VSVYESSGETLNTQPQPREAVVRILMISLERRRQTILMIYLLRSSFKVEDIVACTHLLAEVEYAQLEVELNTPVMVPQWKTLGTML